MMLTVFQNARIVDPSRGIDETGSVIVEGKGGGGAGAGGRGGGGAG
ncbi:dihydroorotase, partial [Rhizobiaceae sp. 2RAB30]